MGTLNQCLHVWHWKLTVLDGINAAMKHPIPSRNAIGAAIQPMMGIHIRQPPLMNAAKPIISGPMRRVLALPQRGQGTHAVVRGRPGAAAPQRGHAGASVDTYWPQSRQGTSGKEDRFRESGTGGRPAAASRRGETDGYG